MNIRLQKFFANSGDPYDLDLILNEWTDSQWETTHNFIQWVFPTSEKSKYNLDAPILDAKTAKYIRDNHDRVIHQSVLRFIKFLKNEDALRFRNHNFLRVTRVIKSLKEMGFEQYAQSFFNYVMSWTLVNGQHFEYWVKAMETKKLFDN